MIEFGTPRFLVLSLPRSRSAWMSHWLSYGGKEVGHDMGADCASFAEFKKGLEGLDGSCETGAMIGWRLIRQEMPEVKLAVVRRDPVEVWAALAAKGLEVPMEELVKRWVMLGSVAAQPGVLSMDYAALNDPECCRVLWDFCLDLPFDWKWYTHFQSLRIEVNMPQRVLKLAKNHERLLALEEDVRKRSAGLLGAKWLN